MPGFLFVINSKKIVASKILGSQKKSGSLKKYLFKNHGHDLHVVNLSLH